MAINEISLDRLCAALCEVMGIDPPLFANEADKRLTEYVRNKLGGEKVERVIMYNPDAVAQWIYEKYADILADVTDRTEISLPYATVMPSVTPVCFGTMYTGAQPDVHGIKKYEKPVIAIDTIFDALIRAGKKPVILAENNCSMAKIFLEREMDYFIFASCEEINTKAKELILSDEYDFIVIYNGNYDTVMHKFGPESREALAELSANARAFAEVDEIVSNNLHGKNTLIGFAMDHGCHEIDGALGSHGLFMDEDINITHHYKVYKK